MSVNKEPTKIPVAIKERTRKAVIITEYQQPYRVEVWRQDVELDAKGVALRFDDHPNPVDVMAADVMTDTYTGVDPVDGKEKTVSNAFLMLSLADRFDRWAQPEATPVPPVLQDEPQS